jgi:AraC family transcriptional regulator
MPTERDILRLLREVGNHLDGDVSLERLAARAGWSPFHFHRAFRKVVGETPKQYTLRVRLERAAARLVTTDDPVLAIAAAEGFGSHEVFTRAFRRRFGCTPIAYREAALRDAPAHTRLRHLTLIDATAPCIGLFHITLDHPFRRIAMPTLSIERRHLPEQPILIVRRRPARHELSSAIAEGVGKVFTYAQSRGLALAGHPFTRYLSTGPGLFTIEVGFRFADAVRGEGEIESGVLPAGAAAVGVHAGPYDQLGETYAAIERWIETNGTRPAGAPWEWYVTDPGEHPDPADWRTEVYWPVAE